MNDRPFASYLISLNREASLAPVFASRFSHIILEVEGFSWYGFIPPDCAFRYLEQGATKGKTVFIQLDALLQAHNEAKILAYIDQLATTDAILRLQDLGLAYYIKQHHPKLRFVLVLGNQGKNLEAWLQLVRYFGPQLYGLAVSPEIPYLELVDLIAQFVASFSIQRPADLPPSELAAGKDMPVFEMLGAGKIPLFYSPRALLPENQPFLYSSVEKQSSFAGLAFTNQLGTHLYYERDLFCLETLTDVPSHLRVRIACNKAQQWQTLLDHFPTVGWAEKLHQAWGELTTQGFFRVNRTHAQFKLLKNQSLQPQASSAAVLVGKVLEYVPASHNLIELEQPLSLPVELFFITPEHKKIPSLLDQATHFPSRQPATDLKVGLYLIPPIKSLVYQSLIYKPQKSTTEA